MARIYGVILSFLLSAVGALAVQSAELPPDFYPGKAEPLITDQGAFQAFISRNTDKLTRIAQLMAIVHANPQIRGCVGKEVNFCVASLAQILPIGSRFTSDPNYRSQNAPLDEPESDINGKALKSNIMLVVLGSTPLMTVNLDQNTDGKVARVDASLAEDPLFARTFDDYEKTRIYDIALAVLPGTCDLSNRRKFYQFIENRLKPTTTTSHDIDTNALAIIDNTSLEVTGTLCGLPVSIRSVGSVSTDDVTAANLHGVSVSSWFTVSAPVPPLGAVPGLTAPSGAPGTSALHLGVSLLNLPPEEASAIHRSGLSGAWVMKVEPGSVAEKAGLKPGDIVTDYDGTPIHAPADLQAVVRPTKGADATLKVVRPNGTTGNDLELRAQF